MTRKAAVAFLMEFCRPFSVRMPALAEAIAALESGGGKKPERAPSERGLAFADWFRSTLPPSANLAAAWRENFARSFDEMIEHDGRTPEDIFRVCKWGREHAFWRGHFMSPAKLRARRDGAQFFDRFFEAMKGAAGGSAAERKASRSAGEYGLRAGEGPRVRKPPGTP